MRSTSAPCAARVRPQIGPAMTRVRSAPPHPGERTLARGQGARGGGAETLDLEHRNSGEGRGLRMGGPLAGRAQRVSGQPPRRQRVFQLEGAGPGERARNRIVVVHAAKFSQDSLAMVRVRHVKLHPPPGRVAEVRLCPVWSLDRRPVDPKVALAAIGDGGVTHRDPNRLHGAGAQPPQLAGGEARRSDTGARRGADREHRGKRGLFAGELDPFECSGITIRKRPEPFERGACRDRSSIRVCQAGRLPSNRASKSL